MGAKSEIEYTFRPHLPFSGEATKRHGPQNRNQELHSDWRITGLLVCHLGRVVEKGAAQIWSGDIKKQTANNRLKASLLEVLSKTNRIKMLRGLSHPDLSKIYQEEFADGKNFDNIPFFEGDPENTPTFEPLTILFEEVDKIFDTDLLQRFKELGPDPSNKQRVHPNLRYLVETALTLGKLSIEKSPFPPSHIFIPNISLPVGHQEKNSNLRIPLVQFDGIFLFNKNFRKLDKKEGVDLLKQCQSKEPWAILETKHFHKVSHVTGRFRGPIKYDVAEIKNKLAKIIFTLPEGKKFNFPKFITVIYLRGTMDHDIHVEQLNSLFFEKWADTLEHNLEQGHLNEKDGYLARRLISLLREKAVIEEKKEKKMATQNRPKIKKGEKLVQGSFRFRQKKSR